MTKKRPRRHRRGRQPLTIRQQLWLVGGPRTDPGPFDFPRWDRGTFEDDEEALEAWAYWGQELMAAWEMDEVPEWIEQLEATGD